MRHLVRFLALVALTAGLSARVSADGPRGTAGVGAVKYLEAIDGQLALTPTERGLLGRNGFVVASRLEFSSYAHAYESIHDSDQPVYVSTDSILHAIYKSNDSLIADLEDKILSPLLERVLQRLHAALPAAVAAYPPEVAADVDLYLTVARRLLTEKPVPAALRDAATERAATALCARAKAAGAPDVIDLFGAQRTVDFTMFTPRGHYAAHGLEAYFRAAMWLSRVKLELAAKAPRQPVAALALTDLVRRAGVERELGQLERAWELLAGRRGDLSLARLAEVRAQAGLHDLRDPQVAPRLREAVGGRDPAATLLGARLGADFAPLKSLAHRSVLNRQRIGAADVTAILGHDRARAYLAEDLERYPGLDARLRDARQAMRDAPTGPDTGLYGAWLAAIRALADRPAGVRPAFMETPAFQDLRLNSAVAAYGQLRHNYVLMADQPAADGSCRIPDAYVEPTPTVYQALIAYARRGRSTLAAIDPKDEVAGRAYFARLEDVLTKLLAVVTDELGGRPLSKAHLRFLSSIAAYRPAEENCVDPQPARFDGWYFDLFRANEEGLEDADFIADYFTSPSDESVAYLGAGPPRLGLFVVESGGPPRAFVGPVARAYEYRGPLGRRLDDQSAKQLDGKLDPWARSYTAPTPAGPGELTLRHDRRRQRLAVTSQRALGPVTAELLDAHGRPLVADTRPVGVGTTTFQFPHAARWRKSGRAIRLRVGDFSEVARRDENGDGLLVGHAAAPAAAPAR